MRVAFFRPVHRRALTGAAVSAFALGACGPDDDPLAPRTLAGNWSLTAEVSNVAAGIRCEGSGLVALSLDGETVSGTGAFPRHCTGAQLETVFEHAFTGVMLDANTLRWHDALGCTYVGQRTSDTRLDGTVTCTVLVGTGEVTLSGPWSATR
jgi:hypothetical protein